MATLKSIIKNRSLVLIGLSESVSNIGNWITMMAVLTMVLFRGGGGVKESSLIMLSGLLPTLLFSPVAGWLCDRFDRRKLMIASELLSGLLIAGLIFVTRFEWILVILALESASLAIMAPARQSVIPDLVTREELTGANAFLQQLSGIIKISAPMLAGLVLSILTPHQAIILDVITFGLSAVVLLRLPKLLPHTQEQAIAESGQASDGQSIPETLRRTPVLRLLFISIFVTIAVIIGFDTLAPVYIRDVIGQGERFMGFSIGLVGLGTVGVSFFLMTRKKSGDTWRDLVTGLVLMTAIPLGLSVGTLIGSSILRSVLVLVVSLLGGIGVGFIHVQSGTLLQTNTPAALLGRMSGWFQGVAVSGQLFGLLITPLVVPGLLGMGAFFAIGAAIILAISLYAIVSPRGTIQVVEVEANG